MKTALESRRSANLEGVEKALIAGDLSELTPQERLAYYHRVCESVGLNEMTRPFEYIKLNGKLTLYARKDATEQLRDIHGVSITDLQENEREGVYIVTAKAVNAKGRTDMAKGAVNLKGLQGEALANAIMKAETKAKRRVTLSICGLGWLDETEIETIPDARPVVVTEQGEIVTQPAKVLALSPAPQVETLTPRECNLFRELAIRKGIDIDKKLSQQDKPTLENLPLDQAQKLHEWLKSKPDANASPEQPTDAPQATLTPTQKQIEYFYSELAKSGKERFASWTGQLQHFNKWLSDTDLEFNHEVNSIADISEEVGKPYSRYLGDLIAQQFEKRDDPLM